MTSAQDTKKEKRQLWHMRNHQQDKASSQYILQLPDNRQ